MFDCIGQKLKTAAKAVFYIGLVISVVTGVVMLGVIEFMALPLGVGGILLSWLGSLLIYGFGELIECAQKLAGREEAPQEAPVEEKEPVGPVSYSGWTCPHCGTVNILGDHKCKNCGKS